MATIRLPEWGRVRVPDLTNDQRERLSDLSVAWKEANRLPALPLAFEGTDGKTLVTKQYVGVIETDDIAIEIYPKLDESMEENHTLGDDKPKSVLENLMWLLKVSGYDDLVDTGDGGLNESHKAFPDLFALLMAKRLRDELARGVPRSYEHFEEDLKTVRGRLLIGQQVTRNFNRWDRIACTFDEFTPDTTVCRILRCACQTLHGRVRHAEARRLLSECLGLLDEVSDISAAEALHHANLLPPWSHGMERFSRPFTLAVRLLRGLSHDLLAGHQDTFVFLLDMNRVFEAFVTAALEARFGGPITTQQAIGTLLKTNPGGIQQKPDFLWGTQQTTWIGDAKYKQLTAGMEASLTFAKDETAPAGRFLSPDDIRQLTVYAEIVRRKKSQDAIPHLALFYPFQGSETQLRADSTIAWNDSPLWLVPVLLQKQELLRAVLPANFPDNEHQSPQYVPGGGVSCPPLSS
ncbi:McrC family protein [Armatimonas sp.]|uniref:McrC family protein n=1 Tax=Armatimonas sp. TaxID=1872638 RepID=UPI00374DD65B